MSKQVNCKDGYEIVNGHHKWLAAQKVGMENIPICIKNYNI
ncbi:MAG: ParB N-terminal domain-containing protein [Lachnospiraceae bacterium]|nr:ParB N-terminal domain-containing protein [Lachnospiraceae bacterium]